MPTGLEWGGHQWLSVAVGLIVGIFSFLWVGTDRLQLAILVAFLYGMTAGLGLREIYGFLR